MEGLEALEHSCPIELGLLYGEALLGAKEHVEFSTRAVIHTDRSVCLVFELELLLHCKLGGFTVLVCFFA